jgi:hypothetical protein
VYEKRSFGHAGSQWSIHENSYLHMQLMRPTVERERTRPRSSEFFTRNHICTLY